MFNLDPNFIPDFSYLQELQEAPLLPIEVSIAHLSGFGHSVQTLNPSPSHSGYLNPQVENQNTPNYSRELNNFSIFNLPSAVNKIAFPELISHEDHGESVPVNDGFTLTDLTNCQQISQKLPSGHSSVTFSQPSLHPVALVGPQTENTQQQVHTKANMFKLAESSGYSGPLTATPGEVYHRAYRRAHNAEMALSGDKDKAKLAGRTAGQAERERVKKSSACGLGESLTITPREAYMRAYHKAYHKAYRAEMALSSDKDKAKQAGQAAGKPAGKTASNAVKECVKESSTSGSGEFLSPSQLISHKAKGIFTVQIEPISR